MSNDIFHHENLYRGKPVKDLFAKRITICGVGALGSNLVDNLTRQGFTRIRVVDKDRIELHNLNNQCYNRSHVGSTKVAALHRVVFDAVGVEIETEHKELTSSNVKKLLRNTDLVVDCFDNSTSRRIVTDFCKANNLPCLHAGLNGGFGEVVWNDNYVVPEDLPGEERACDQHLARNIVMLTVVVTTEEIINFVLNKNKRKFYITLGDLNIKNA